MIWLYVAFATLTSLIFDTWYPIIALLIAVIIMKIFQFFDIE